jgi:hypothetical protein
MNTSAATKELAVPGPCARPACLSLLSCLSLSLLLALGCAQSGSSAGGSGGSNASGSGGKGSGGNGTGGNGTGGNGSGGSATGSGGNGTGGNGSGGSATGAGGSGGSSTGGSGGSATGGSPGTGGGTGGSGTGGAIVSGTGGGNGGAGSSGAAGAAGSGGAAGHGASGGSAGGLGASHCAARPGMVFCDDFEADAPGVPPSPWTTMSEKSTDVAIDGTSPAASGTKSVHITDLTDSNPYDTFLALHDTQVLPVSGGKLYLRFYINLKAGNTQGHNTLVRGDLFATQGTGNNLLFGEDNGMIMESINGDGQAAMSNNNFYTDGKIGANYPAGVWTCVELLLDHNTPAIDVWVNGIEVPDLHSTKWGIDAYDYLRFGFEKYAGPTSELWFDDIAIGTQPIGCN